MTEIYKVGDMLRVLNDTYDINDEGERNRVRKGSVIPVVEFLPDEDAGYWISPRGAEIRSLVEFTEEELNRDFMLITEETLEEVIFPCTRNPETGNLTFGDLSAEPKEEYSGNSVDYYKVKVDSPTTQESPYSAEANDIIEALGLTFAEGNLLKAVWRIAADRKGLKKKGNNSVYDAEKLVFFANRVLVQEKAK